MSLSSTCKRHPVLATVLAWLIVMTPVGMTAEAAFHLEYVNEPTKGLSFMPEVIGLRTTPAPSYTPLRASGTDEIRQVRFIEPKLSPWSCIAKYESGGDWSINTGNGYYGGLQFSASTWRSAGGTRYAPYAHQASPEEQVAVAESWLAKTNWGQWPNTSRRCGLR